MKKLDLKTHDLIADNIEGLKELFPEAFADGKIDFDALRLLLGDSVEKEKERFGLSWPGKQDAIKMALVQNTGTLRPKKEESKDWDTTGNLFIEGDNLEVLRVLLETYRGKVKMIYIDPPYNTGNDFVYKDDFADNVVSYKEKASENMKSNAATAGRYHSNWLSMMYPRLKLAKEFLKDDGVIFVSIDDKESPHLREMMDEIFGEENFIGVTTWYKKRKGSFLSDEFVSLTEYIYIYKSSSLLSGLHGGSPETGESQPIVKRTNTHKNLFFNGGSVKTKLKDGLYPSGSYGDGTSAVKLMNEIRVIDGTISTDFTLDGPFTWNQGMLDSELKDGATIVINTKNFQPRAYRNYSENDHKGFPSFLDGREFSATTDDAYEELKRIFNEEKIFDYSKPWQLIEKLIHAACWNDPKSIILDFFAGSGTVAQALMSQNSTDNGDRRFVLVQIPEVTPEDSEARKAGYESIADIAKERIRRAGEIIKNENAEKSLDVGFKVFALDTSNLSRWDEKTNDLQGSLLEHIQGVKADRTQDDLLYEVLLKYGIDLSTPIVTETINGKRIYNVGEGYLLVCLEEGVDLKTIEIIAAKKPTRVVFLDKSFATDIVKLNAEQTLKKAGVEDLRVL